jgi:hypothetical protein
MQQAPWYQKLQTHLGDNPFTVIFTSISFAAFAWLLWRLTFSLGEEDSVTYPQSLNQLVGLLGGLAGWSLGIAWSPFTPAEETRFRRIARVVTAFLGGYFLSKAEAFFDDVLFNADETVKATAWLRVGIFIAAFLLGLLVTFVHRLYAFNRAGNKLMHVPVELVDEVDTLIQKASKKAASQKEARPDPT